MSKKQYDETKALVRSLVEDTLATKKLVNVTTITMTAYGVRNEIEMDSVIENITNSGLGMPFTKFCNSRNWNQDEAREVIEKLGYIVNNLVQPKALINLDGERGEHIVKVSDCTLYNNSAGTLFVNTSSPTLERLTGELVGITNGYNEDFRTAETAGVHMRNVLRDSSVKERFPFIKNEL